MAMNELAIGLADVINGADVRMIQCGSRLRFAPKAFESLRIFRQLLGQKLERDEAAGA